MMKKTTLNTILLLAFSPACLAHDEGFIMDGILQGIAHPLTGLDHLLTLIAVGLLAAKRDQIEKTILPTVFLLSMVMGFILSISGQPLDRVEQVIAISVFILGVWLVSDRQINNILLLIMVSAIAVAHGYAHGVDVVGPAMNYLSGFMLSSFLLIVIPLLAFQYASPIKNKIQSCFGAIVAALGLFYLLQV